jgi:septal ring factor EnvC (AmiA/AmiB activator)
LISLVFYIITYMNRLFNALLLKFLFVFCCGLASCVSVNGITNELNEESSGYRRALAAETSTTNQQLAERRQLQSQLDSAQNREAKLKAGGVPPNEETELSKVRQDIARLKKQLSALAAAG